MLPEVGSLCYLGVGCSLGGAGSLGWAGRWGACCSWWVELLGRHNFVGEMPLGGTVGLPVPAAGGAAARQTLARGCWPGRWPGKWVEHSSGTAAAAGAVAAAGGPAGGPQAAVCTQLERGHGEKTKAG